MCGSRARRLPFGVSSLLGLGLPVSPRERTFRSPSEPGTEHADVNHPVMPSACSGTEFDPYPSVTARRRTDREIAKSAKETPRAPRFVGACCLSARWLCEVESTHL